MILRYDTKRFSDLVAGLANALASSGTTEQVATAIRKLPLVTLTTALVDARAVTALATDLHAELAEREGDLVAWPVTAGNMPLVLGAQLGVIAVGPRPTATIVLGGSECPVPDWGSTTYLVLNPGQVTHRGPDVEIMAKTLKLQAEIDEGLIELAEKQLPRLGPMIELLATTINQVRRGSDFTTGIASLRWELRQVSEGEHNKDWAARVATLVSMLWAVAAESDTALAWLLMETEPALIDA